MNKRRDLSLKDWQLLSAYLDNQLSDVEKRQMDERLLSEPECRQALDTLRRTSILLRSLPVRRVPKNFTLSAQSLPKRIFPSFTGILRFSSAMVALLLVAAFALDLAQKPAMMAANKSAEDMQPAAAAMESAKVLAAEPTAAEPPMIIFWGAPAPVMGVYGKGGGGGGAEGSGLGGGGAAAGFYGVGGGGAQPESIPNIVPTEAPPGVETVPSAKLPIPESIPEPSAETPAASAAEPMSGSGPILGVWATEEKTAVNEVPETPLRQPASNVAIPFRLLEIVLALLLVVTALPAWLIKRK